jgi:exopolysaccharide biosynthesis polyprenyl glycosylphosphotransferase
LDACFCALQLVVDGALLMAGFILAYWVRFTWDVIPAFSAYVPPLTRYLPLFGGGTLVCLAALGAVGSYTTDREGGRNLYALLASYGVIFAVLFALKLGVEYSRATLFLAAVLQFALLKIGRFAVGTVHTHARDRLTPVPVIAVGGDSLIELVERLLPDEGGYRLVNCLRTREEEDPAVLQQRLREALDHFGVPGAWLIMGDLRAPAEFFDELMFECEKRLVEPRLAFSSHLMAHLELERRQFNELVMLGPRKLPLDRLSNRVIKRAMDICGGLVGLLLAGPAALVAALLVRLESSGPLFYVQERCGRDGQTFPLYKVRTMVPDAEEETGPVWATEDDPRKTRIGAFLRRFCIDEIPQFWNVLRGDMSLVGPRPERPVFVSRFREEFQSYMTRHRIKPGLTGLAQVRGWRGNSSVEKRLECDLEYLTQWSPLLDVKIMLLSFFCVLKGTNSY